MCRSTLKIEELAEMEKVRASFLAANCVHRSLRHGVTDAEAPAEAWKRRICAQKSNKKRGIIGPAIDVEGLFLWEFHIVTKTQVFIGNIRWWWHCLIKTFPQLLNLTPFVQQLRDAAKKCGLFGLQKITAALWQKGQGIGSNSTDDNCGRGESTAHKSLYQFCKMIRVLHGEKYLQQPNAAD